VFEFESVTVMDEMLPPLWVMKVTNTNIVSPAVFAELKEEVADETLTSEDPLLTALPWTNAGVAADVVNVSSAE
jgi:hypothetical protein